jgi:lambda family phage portal protein
MNTGLIYPNGRAVSTADVAKVRASAVAAALVRGDTHYNGARQAGTFLGEWRPSIRSADASYLPDRDRLTARVRDLTRNDPVASSIVTRRVNSAIGSGWRRTSRPDWRALGITREAAAELGRQIEGEWRRYAQGAFFQADAERRLTFGQLLRVAAHHVMVDGEALGLMEWDTEGLTRYATRLRLVDPDRLSNPNGAPDSETLRGGVEDNADGVPWRYWIREGHPADLGTVRSLTWTSRERFTAHGRPRVLHVFEATRAGQTRGVSRFVAVLKSMKGWSHLTDAQIEAAVLNALFIAFVKSSAGPAAVSESFTSDDLVDWAKGRDDAYGKSPISLTNGARIPVLGLGDEVEMQTTARDVSDYEPFTRAILRLTCACAGVTYEEGTMDYSQTNYSSARAAMIPAYQETLAMRGWIESGMATPHHLCWLEEAFDRGYIMPPPGAPDFYDAPEAYAEGRWVGPARGYVDPTKEIDAAAARIEAGVSTLEDECAEQGKDWEEVIEQRKIELDLLEELGLQPSAGALSLAAAAARQPEQMQPRGA